MYVLTQTTKTANIIKLHAKTFDYSVLLISSMSFIDKHPAENIENTWHAIIAIKLRISEKAQLLSTAVKWYNSTKNLKTAKR